MTEDLRHLSLRKKIGQLFFIGVSGPELDVQTCGLLDEVSPGGVCLFARNIREASQTRVLLDQLREALVIEPLLSIDQEGGTVDRLRRLITPMAAAGRIRTPEQAAHMASLIGETISILGFNMDFAPVVDIIDDVRRGSSNGLFTRPFGNSKEETAAFAGEFLRNLQTQGPIGCIKHFPGLGAAVVDSHEELPSVEISEEEFVSVDLYPYKELLNTGDVHSIMVGHAGYPKLDLQESDQNGRLLPASLSQNFITTLLRDELLFDGLVITDDLEMGAIVNNYGIGEACVLAFEAGVDMLAICADPVNVRIGFEAVIVAAEQGRIDNARIDASVSRIARVKSMLCVPPAFDQQRLNELSDETALFNSTLEQI